MDGNMNMVPPSYVNNNVRVTKFLMIETRDDYKSPYQRSFEVTATGDTLNRFDSLLRTYGSTNELNNMNVAQYIPDAIGLTPMPTNKANIPNGWNTRRIRFIMEVETDFNGATQVSYIQGFSDYLDTSISGFLDPNIVFHINSITVVTKTFDPSSGRWLVMPRVNYNVISDLAAGGKVSPRYVMESPDNLTSIARPTDIMQSLYTIEHVGHNGGKVIDTSGFVGVNSYASARNNSDPLTYFTKTLNGFIDARSNVSSITADTTAMFRAGTSSSYLTEDTPINNPFIRAIYNVTGEIEPTSFTLGTLKLIDPNSENVNRFITRSETPINTTVDMLSTADTADTLNPTKEVIKATIIANAINSILVTNMLSKLSVSFSNLKGPNAIVTITDINSFIDGVDLQRECGCVTNHIKSVLMPVLTDNNQTLIEAFVTTDILGDTSVGISVNMGSVVVFRFPTFADSLYSPVVTTKAVKAAAVDSFGSFMDSVIMN